MLRTQEKLKSQRHNVLAEEINKIGLTLKRIGGGGGGGRGCVQFETPMVFQKMRLLERG